MRDEDRFDEDWQAYVCADCAPSPFEDEDEPDEYDKPYVLLLPEGEEPPEHCPRCGDSLSFIEGAKGLRIANTPAERWAKRHADD